jgi:cell filamentation protein
MSDQTNWTPSPEENKLGLTDKAQLNAQEAKGIVAAELFLFSLESESPISTQLILQFHHIAFSELYNWAGVWRKTHVTVGQLVPPEPERIVPLMYQFVENLNHKISHTKNINDHVDALTFAHYEFVRIHPFVNGNGRTGRMLMNLVALQLGYQPLELYHREGDGRKIYIEAMKSADKGDFKPLNDLIREELTAF